MEFHQDQFCLCGWCHPPRFVVTDLEETKGVTRDDVTGTVKIDSAKCWRNTGRLRQDEMGKMMSLRIVGIDCPHLLYTLLHLGQAFVSWQTTCGSRKQLDSILTNWTLDCSNQALWDDSHVWLTTPKKNVTNYIEILNVSAKKNLNHLQEMSSSKVYANIEILKVWNILR